MRLRNFFSVGVAAIGLLSSMTVAQAASASTSGSTTASATSSATAATYTVQVAADGFTYDPNEVTAKVGDIVLFHFSTGNHSVARAEYGHPCIPYENLGGGRVGFWSGFVPVDGLPENKKPSFSLEINSTEPVFYYCSQTDACVPQGMIGVINPNKTQSLANQALFVKNATFQLSPGEAPPPESPASSSTDSSSLPSSTSSTPEPTSTTSPAATSSHSTLSKGAIAGISIGGVAVIALAALIFYLCGRNRSLATAVRYSQPPQPTHRPNLSDPLKSGPFTPSSQHPSPYSGGYSPDLQKPGMVIGGAAVGMGGGNGHESWNSNAHSMSGAQQQQQQMAQTAHMGSERAMSPPLLSPYSGHHGGSPEAGMTQWSPGAWAQGHQQVKYVSLPTQEMATGVEGRIQQPNSPGFLISPNPNTSHFPHNTNTSNNNYDNSHHNNSYLSTTSSTTAQSPAAPPTQTQTQHVIHEMDGTPQEQPTEPPPGYAVPARATAERPLSFEGGNRAEEVGVEKALR